MPKSIINHPKNVHFASSRLAFFTVNCIRVEDPTHKTTLLEGVEEKPPQQQQPELVKLVSRKKTPSLHGCIGLHAAKPVREKGLNDT